VKLFVKHGIFLFATVLSLSTYSIMADEAVQSSTKSSVENMAKSTPNDVVVGNPNNAISNLKEDDTGRRWIYPTRDFNFSNARFRRSTIFVFF